MITLSDTDCNLLYKRLTELEEAILIMKSAMDSLAALTSEPVGYTTETQIRLLKDHKENAVVCPVNKFPFTVPLYRH